VNGAGNERAEVGRVSLSNSEYRSSWRACAAWPAHAGTTLPVTPASLPQAPQERRVSWPGSGMWAVTAELPFLAEKEKKAWLTGGLNR
jgi:hypothetical protein